MLIDKEITINDKIKLKDKIELLNIDSQKEIFNIIKNDESQYSTNSNGVFFDLLSLKNDVVKKIIEQINFYEATNNDDLKRKELMTDYKLKL